LQYIQPLCIQMEGPRPAAVFDGWKASNTGGQYPLRFCPRKVPPEPASKNNEKSCYPPGTQRHTHSINFVVKSKHERGRCSSARPSRSSRHRFVGLSAPCASPPDSRRPHDALSQTGSRPRTPRKALRSGQAVEFAPRRITAIAPYNNEVDAASALL